MAQHTLPLLFLNLGGEMLYILDQRLKAQKIPADKARKATSKNKLKFYDNYPQQEQKNGGLKCDYICGFLPDSALFEISALLSGEVLNEIAGIMLNQRFLDELFKPQEVYNKGALRNLFHDLAHASIMRLNDASMGKLYDLMIMAVKQQMFFATEPKDLILITLNHLDNVRYLVSAASIHKQLDSAYFLVIKTYGQMSSGELQRLRYNILNFFQDIKVRVSIFLRQHIQNNDGSFKIPASIVIPHGNEIPGSIRVFGNDGCIADLLNFNPGGHYTVAADPGSTELRGTRYTSLGTNMYDTTRGDSSWDQPGLDSNAKWDSPEYNNSSYREELNLLLTQLLGNKHAMNTGNPLRNSDVIKLNLFEMLDEDREKNSSDILDNCIENSPISEEHSNALHKVKTEMMVEEENSDNQLTVLDLLDLA